MVTFRVYVMQGLTSDRHKERIRKIDRRVPRIVINGLRAPFRLVLSWHADIAGYEYVANKPGVAGDLAGIVIVWCISNVPQRTLRGCEQMQHSCFCLQVDYAAADVETIPLERTARASVQELAEVKGQCSIDEQVGEHGRSDKDMMRPLIAEKTRQD